MEVPERTILVTVRARYDPAFEGAVFISLRRYELDGNTDATDQAEVATIDAATDILRAWLEPPKSDV